MTSERITYFYNKYWRLLSSRAIVMLKQHDSIPWGTYKDVVADAFVSLMTYDDNGSDGNVECFLKIKIKNDCLNLIKHYNRRKKHHEIIYETSQDYDNAIDIGSGLLEAVVKEIDNLPVAQRLVFKMRYIDEMSRRDICKALKIQLGTFDTHMMRAKQRIRSVFKDVQI